MDGNISRKIWASIQSSGVPLELKVYETISGFEGWDANPAQYYVDSDYNKGREFDLHATRVVGDEHDQFALMLNLVVECKSIPGNAWAFFPIKGLFGVLPSVDAIEIAGNRQAIKVLEPFNFYSVGRKSGCRHYHETLIDDSKSNWKGSKRPDNVFEAISTVVKATEFLRKKRVDELKEFIQEYAGYNLRGVERETINYVTSRIEVFQPLIVFDGVLCTVDLGTNSMVDADEVTLVWEYRSGSYEVSYLPIDICRKERLSTYIRRSEKKLAASRELALKKGEDGKTWANSHLSRVAELLRRPQEFQNRPS